MAVGTALGVIPEPRSWPHLGFVAITVAFGLETLRAMLSLLVYVLREGYGWDAIQVGILALVIFSTGFQAGPLTRRLGTGATLAIAGGGVGVLRLVAQIWPVYPVVDLGLSIAGAFLFIVFLFAMVEHARGKDGVGTAGCGLAFLLGVSLDTFLMGAFSTWEPFWRFGIGSMWAVTLMVMAQIVCLVYVLGFGSLISSPIRPQSQWSNVNPPGIDSSLPWLALGPIIFLQLQVFQNIAGFAAVTGWTLPQAFLGIVISNVVGLLVAALVVSKPSCGAWGPALLLGVLLTGTLGIGSSLPNIAAGALIVGQACLSALLIIVFSAFETTGEAADTGTGRQPEQGGTQESDAQPSSAFHGIGMVLLMALLFGYYASLELEMPFSREMLLPAAGVIVAVAALWASVSSQPSGISYFPVWRPAAFAAVFAIAPVVMLLTWQTPQQVEGNGYPVRVMTYNLHNGFNTDGLLDLEALADVIEDEEADIVALQEVSRGWVINGSADMLLWLSQRLDMPYIYGPSMEHFWGNAILSRFPVTDWGKVDLPPRDLTLLRQFTWADFALGEGQHLRVIATHFHHPEDGGETRLLQAEALLSFWNAHPKTVVLADLNAEPDSLEITAFRRAGFADALEGVASRATFPSYEPAERIDYILASPDLRLSKPSIPRTRASDHLPVSATVESKQ